MAGSTIQVFPDLSTNNELITTFVTELLFRSKVSDENRPNIIIFRPSGRPADEFKENMIPNLARFENVLLVIASDQPDLDISDLVPDEHKKRILDVVSVVMVSGKLDTGHPETRRAFNTLKKSRFKWKVPDWNAQLNDNFLQERNATHPDPNNIIEVPIADLVNLNITQEKVVIEFRNKRPFDPTEQRKTEALLNAERRKTKRLEEELAKLQTKFQRQAFDMKRELKRTEDRWACKTVNKTSDKKSPNSLLPNRRCFSAHNIRVNSNLT